MSILEQMAKGEYKPDEAVINDVAAKTNLSTKISDNFGEKESPSIFDFDLDVEVGRPRNKTEVLDETKGETPVNKFQTDIQSIEYKIARLDAKNTLDEFICKMYSLDKETLLAIRASEEYSVYSEASFDLEVIVPINIDDKWTNIEDKSLDRITTFMETHGKDLPIDDAFRYAKLANQALKKKTVTDDKKAEADAASKSNVIVLELSAGFADRMKSINPILEHDDIKAKSSQKKMVDYMAPSELEEIIKEKSQLLGEKSKNALDAIDEYEPESLDR